VPLSFGDLIRLLSLGKHRGRMYHVPH
jgi:hypothetical protein